MKQDLRDQIISIMDDVDDLTIATVREDGYPQATTVSYGGNQSQKHWTTYFRKKFTVADASGVSAIFLELKRDDGAVARRTILGRAA